MQVAIRRLLLLSLVSAAAVAVAHEGAHKSGGLATGKVELQSAGPLAFGPDGLLFVGDSLVRRSLRSIPVTRAARRPRRPRSRASTPRSPRYSALRPIRF